MLGGHQPFDKRPDKHGRKDHQNIADDIGQRANQGRNNRKQLGTQIR